MSDQIRGQVSGSAAEVYEQFFIPALFAEWPSHVISAAHIQPGHDVLDVACGTGVLTRETAVSVGSSGSVIGLDINDGMLAVAYEKAPDIEWRHGAAEALPFADNTFDAVVSQFGLMFFADRETAVSEMIRVLKPGGYLAVAVWDSLENTPGYAAVTAMLQRLFGPEPANALRAPFNLGNLNDLRPIFANPEITNLQISTHIGTARFPSIESWMYTDIKGWTLADMLDDDQFAQLLQAAETDLQPFVIADGSVAFDSPAHIVSARKNNNLK